ncbi:MAG: hypothetical protein K2O24_03020 [Muribaculaceae bacterium]|nr:hypothetical protein [Muribaculaceae bacterium]
MQKNIIISEEIRNVVPGYRMVYIEADVANGPVTPELIAEMDRICADVTAGLEIPDINRRPPIAATRAAYKALGKDPNRYRPSQEQLMRRLLKGQGLYHVDTLVDAGNMVSLALGSSIGVFDRDKIKGDTLTLGVGREGEPYEGIGRGPLNIAGLPVIRDAAGGIGTPTSDNERTKAGPDTRRVSICINMYDSETVTPAEAAAMMTDALLRHCSASDVTHTVI